MKRNGWHRAANALVDVWTFLVRWIPSTHVSEKRMFILLLLFHAEILIKILIKSEQRIRSNPGAAKKWKDRRIWRF